MDKKPDKITYEESCFEKTLRKGDQFARRYNEVLPTFLDYPHDEDLTFDVLEKEYGADGVDALIPFAAGNVSGTDAFNPGAAGAPEDMPNEPWHKEDPMEIPPEVSQKEAAFRDLCNAICSLNASITLCCCNSYGALITSQQRPKSLNILYYCNRAFLIFASAISELMPMMGYPQVIACTRRSMHYLSLAKQLLQELCSENSQVATTINPVFSLIDQNLQKMREFIDECKKLPSTDTQF